MKTRRSMRLVALVVPAALAALSAAPVRAQTPAELIEAMSQRQRDALANVENLTIVQEFMGTEMTMYMERTQGEKGPTLVPRTMIMGGMTIPVSEGDAGSASPWLSLQADMEERMAASARDGGPGTVDGRAARILEFEGWDAFTPPGQELPPNMDMSSAAIRMFVDTERLLPLRIEMSGTAEVEGEAKPFTMTMDFEDYQEASGFPYPRRTVMDMGELMALTSGMDPEEMRAQIAQARAQLDQMPPEQRQMMGEMIENQIAQVERMLNGEPMVMTVSEVRVNAGPPGGR